MKCPLGISKFLEENSSLSHSVVFLYFFALITEEGCLISSCYSLELDYTMEVRNRFKGLNLIDRVPDELWTEVRDIVQETGIKTIPMEKKYKKSKMAVWGGLKNSCEDKGSEKQRRK